MVQQGSNSFPQSPQSSMGQSAVCGLNNPLSDSQPNSPSAMGNGNENPMPAVNASRRTAADVQSTLSSLSDVSQEELVSKLRTVVNQNLDLKESLAQNNLALRHQLGLVVRWTQQQQQHKHHQQQRVDALTRHVTALQIENSALKAGKDIKTPCSGSDESSVSVLQDRLNSALQHAAALQEDKDKLANLRAKLEADVTLLKCDLTTSRGDQERLQLERAHLLATSTELKNQLRHHHLSQQQHNASNTSGDAELHREREKTLQQECDQLRADLHRLGTKLAAMEAQRDHRQHESADVSGSSNIEFLKLKDEASLLKEDVELLETTLSGERVKLSEERSANSRAASEMASLRSELRDARDTIHRNTNTDYYYQTKIKTINEQHDAVTAKLLSYEELLASKNEELSKLKKESGQAKARLSEMQSEGETIAILRAQVEVYQGDFRAEREAREALASEREQLRDELRQLQARNTQLMDEMHAQQHLPATLTLRGGSRGGTPPASLSEGGAEGGAARHSALMDHLSQHLDSKEGDKKEEKVPAAVVDESLFYCPKCNKSFPQLKPLEEHVNKCLDED